MLISLLVLGSLQANNPPANIPELVADYVGQDAAFQAGVKTGLASNSGQSSQSNPVASGITEGIKQLVAVTIVLGAGNYIAKKIGAYITGEADEETTKNTLSNLNAELALLDAQSATLYRDFITYREIYNGGQNIKINKEEAQKQIEKLWKAYKDNSAEKEILALKIKNYREKLSTQGKADVDASSQNAVPQTLAQATQLPTRRITPALATQGLAAQRAAAAA